jgi:hypothetical protein
MPRVRTTSPAAPYAGWRAAAATALVVPGATLAHTWAGGHAPSLPALAATCALVLGTSALVLRGSVRPRVLLPLLVAAQAGLHEAFVALEAVGHAHHLQAAAPAATPWTWRMALAHLAVAGLTALVWRLCERAVAVVVAATTHRAAYVAGRRDPRPARRAERPRHPGFLLVLAPRRGPPAPTGHA